MPASSPPDAPSAAAAHRRLAVTVIACAALVVAAAVVALLLGRPPRETPSAAGAPVTAPDAGPPLGIDDYVRLSPGAWDTHPDPDVARLLQPDLRDRIDEYGQPVSSNAAGLRERDVALPKPPGTTRVVLLGDSMVFGQGVRAEERIGPFLEQLVAERAPRPVPFEALHVGMGSWNILAECAFLRRQLADLQPDLVVHVVVNNDLDDSVSARGFGKPATFSRQHARRADGLVYTKWPERYLGTRRKNYLADGLDWESTERYRRAGDAIVQLARAVEAHGGRYVLLSSWTSRQDLAREWFASRLPADAVVYLPRTFTEDRAHWVRPDDGHWNPLAQRLLARLLYAFVVQRELLPGLALPRWDDAERLLAGIDGEGRREAARELTVRERARKLPIAPRLDLAALDDDAGAQVHGGVDADGDVSPYASILLAHDVEGDGRPRRLFVHAERYSRPELAGAELEVLLDEVPVARLDLAGSAPIELAVPVPRELADRPFLSLRFVADDWVYKGRELRRCVCFRLRSAELLHAER